MRLIRGISAIFLCFLLLGLLSLTGAEETASTDDDLSSSDWDSYLSGSDTGSFDLSSLLSEDLVSSILEFLLTLFLSLFGVSFS